MDIYIKPAKKVMIAGRTEVLLQDIAEVVAVKEVKAKLKKIKLLDITPVKKASFLISITDIIDAIKKVCPDDTVNNVGEMDIVIEYRAEKSKDNPYWKWTKIAFVSLVLLAGSATAIMSFHSDAQMPEVFKKYYEIFFGVKSDKPMIIDISYSIGLAVGITVFFNHLAGKKVTDDPTPIEVEMSIYDEEITDTVIDVLNTNRIRKEEKQ